MTKQDPVVLEKFKFLESVLSRFTENTYNQLHPLIENPQTIYESFNGKSLKVDVYGYEQKDGELSVLLSEIIDWEGEEIRSWFSVGFRKLRSGEVVTPSFDKNTHCSFCEEKSYFTTDLPIEQWTMYHCRQCRNFFEPTSYLMRTVGVGFCSVLSLVSLFVLFMGLFMLAVNITKHTFFSGSMVMAGVLILGGFGTLYVLVKKIRLAITTPMLMRVSEFLIF